MLPFREVRRKIPEVIIKSGFIISLAKLRININLNN